ncbi:hypothetical protein Vse01_10540 [Micromonospora sediminimaris]|uniref:Uncharacterized protein n=1 Tax=Micromonospora sediminimaris TaxID=547162 RepID=A0A9W5UN37_9ACTN|nr:hypothetical protein Vse01_10540 [Micromonospora sediminimaris]
MRSRRAVASSTSPVSSSGSIVTVLTLVARAHPRRRGIHFRRGVARPTVCASDPFDRVTRRSSAASRPGHHRGRSTRFVRGAGAEEVVVMPVTAPVYHPHRH